MHPRERTLHHGDRDGLFASFNGKIFLMLRLLLKYAKMVATVRPRQSWVTISYMFEPAFEADDEHENKSTEDRDGEHFAAARTV